MSNNPPANNPAAKICAICGEDCSGRARTKDRKGRYFCKPCYQAALERQQAKPVEEAASQEIGLEPASTAGTGGSPGHSGSTQPCPSCDQPLPVETNICIDCGINTQTGRSIVTSRGLNEEAVELKSRRVIRWVSIPTIFGFSPVASSALGSRKPYATWAIAALTVLVSFWFWFSSDAQMTNRKNLMLWAGDAPLTAESIAVFREWTRWGDGEALETAVQRVRQTYAQEGRQMQSEDTLLVAAHQSLTPRQQYAGKPRWYQQFTHALLHGDLFHLAGNLVFLLIFGSRINSLVGNTGVLLAYPVFGVIAAWAQILTMSAGEPRPMVGASGAIMGMCGAYLVLFPVNRVYMSVWIRILFFFRMKIWPVRGFWVVIFYIAFDLFFVMLGAETGTAHWAHLGGFFTGIAVALAFLTTRTLNAGGGDIISVIFGRHAWGLLGRPSETGRPGLRLPGA